MTDCPSLPEGFRAAGMHAKIKQSGAFDLGLVLLEGAAPAAAIYTTNRLNGAHIALCRDHLARSGRRTRALLVNSGNANCATGAQGLADAREVTARLAEVIGCPAEHVLFLSTGVIGAPLPKARILASIPDLVDGARAEGLADFAEAVRTTDTHAKWNVLEAPGPYRVSGIAKGSGMIHPDMATMLAFLLTDGVLDDARGATLSGVAERSFHRLTIDRETSPNDMVLLWSSAARSSPVRSEDLALVSRELCRAIAADGEGATRLVTVVVEGAESEAEAARVGRAIATSPLTKTAVHGRDPNWGRILSAAASCGAAIDVDRARVWIGPAELYANGAPRPENEPAAHRHMLEEHEVVLRIDLASGGASAEVWTCDLSADYVRINADYRT